MCTLTDAPNGRGVSPLAGSLKKIGPDPREFPIDTRESLPVGGVVCIKKEKPEGVENGVYEGGAA